MGGEAVKRLASLLERLASDDGVIDGVAPWGGIRGGGECGVVGSEPCGRDGIASHEPKPSSHSREHVRPQSFSTRSRTQTVSLWWGREQRWRDEWEEETEGTRAVND